MSKYLFEKNGQMKFKSVYLAQFHKDQRNLKNYKHKLIKDILREIRNNNSRNDEEILNILVDTEGRVLSVDYLTLEEILGIFGFLGLI